MWKTYMFIHGDDFLEKRGKKKNISNRKSIRILIGFNNDNDHPFKLFK
jgi:hypothetical protein